VPISREDVVHVARLARLALTDAEIALFEEQLARILDHAERVTSLPTEDVPPTSHAIPLANVMRPDEHEPGLSQEHALAGGPEVEEGHFRVPRIIEDQE
jgi:aspartyl-tRNA(Asn)/glutamyl-tRNA(Gln) amidotransferase subunit C